MSRVQSSPRGNLLWVLAAAVAAWAILLVAAAAVNGVALAILGGVA